MQTAVGGKRSIAWSAFLMLRCACGHRDGGFAALQARDRQAMGVDQYT
jgi:hypothetical protein